MRAVSETLKLRCQREIVKDIHFFGLRTWRYFYPVCHNYKVEFHAQIHGLFLFCFSLEICISWSTDLLMFIVYLFRFFFSFFLILIFSIQVNNNFLSVGNANKEITVVNAHLAIILVNFQLLNCNCSSCYIILHT